MVIDCSSCLITGPDGTGRKYLAKVIAGHFKQEEPYYINLLSYNKDREELINAIFNNKFVQQQKTNVVIIENSHLINVPMQMMILKNMQKDVKYIFITNKQVTTQSHKRYFRSEFYSLFENNILRTIPLNEHKEDIPLLIHHFIGLYNEKYNKNIKDVDKDSFNNLLYYDWPDNIMELNSIIEKVVALAEGTVITADLLYDLFKEQKDLKLIVLNPRLNYKDAVRISRDIVDKHYFQATLDITNNNKSKAAKMLGISLRQFQYKCKSLGL